MTIPGSGAGHRTADTARPAGAVGLKQHLRVAVKPGDGTYLISEREIVHVRDADIAVLAPLLDGSRTLAALAASCSPQLAAADLGAAIGQLLRTGLARFYPDATPAVRAAEAFWDLAGVDGHHARHAIATSHVTVVAVGDTRLAAASMVGALVGAGLPAHVVEPDPAGDGPAAAATVADTPADLTVVLTDDHLRPELVALDAALSDAGRCWLLVKPTGAAPSVGPFLGGGEDDAAHLACFCCLRHRIAANRSQEGFLTSSEAPLLHRPTADTAATRAIAVNLAALAVSKWIAGMRQPDQRRMSSFDAIDGTVTTHDGPRRPQCPRCGDAGLGARTAGTRVTIERRGVPAGRRALDADAVLARFGHLVSPVSGVVRALNRDPRCPDGLYLYSAPRPPAAYLGSAREIADDLCDTSGGTGTTDAAARAGALCEALERYSGQLHGEEVRRRATFVELGAAAVHPNASMLFGAAEYAGARAGVRADDDDPDRGMCHVPDPLDPDAPLDWSPVWSLTRDERRYLPTAFLYTDTSPVPGVVPPAGSRHVIAESNGCAAGASLEEAVLHGLYELVERDAAGIWWYNRTRQPGLDLDACGDPWLLEQRRAHATLGRELWALDLTTDLGVPVVVALSRQVDGGPEMITMGFAADLSPSRALRRAVSEAGQMHAFAAAARSGRLAGARRRRRDAWLHDATVAGHPYLLPADVPPVGAPSRSDGGGLDVGDAVTLVHDRLVAAGLELLVHDRTRPDVGLPVVKVIVPGLRHFARRTAPGRLYDVPVALGRRARPNAVHDLNPTTLIV